MRLRVKPAMRDRVCNEEDSRVARNEGEGCQRVDQGCKDLLVVSFDKPQRQHTDTDAFCFFQFLSTSNDGGSRGDDVIDQQYVFVMNGDRIF